MAFPNIPKNGNDWQRRTTDAVNHLLNQQPNGVFYFQDMPDAGQSYGPTQFPVSYTLIPRGSNAIAGTAATATAVFTVLIDGVTAITITFNAGETSGVMAFASESLPLLTDFEIVAPNPQDATLADITIILALTQ